MKPSTHPAFVFLLAAFHLVAAVQEPPNLPRIPPRTPTANNQRPSQNGMGPRERVIAASLLPWRDPQPVLPRSGCALDESEAIQIEKIYQQLRDDFSVASTGPSRGQAIVEERRAKAFSQRRRRREENQKKSGLQKTKNQRTTTSQYPVA